MSPKTRPKSKDFAIALEAMSS
uniref:Uncharacterized protein n=1 Tax=Arundo donax TaxID=35708 RepID=A0A0A8YIK3_ARUDO